MAEGKYKAGMYTELQKFGRGKEDTRQLLRTGQQGFLEEVIEDWTNTAGLDFTVSEDKALSALQILLDKTDYKGHLPSQEVSSPAFKGRFLMPRLVITFEEYFEAYGLTGKEKRRGGKYQGLQREEAIKALDSLTKPRRLVYQRKYWKGKGKNRRQVYDVIVAEKPLITIGKWSLYRALEGMEAKSVSAGADVPEKRITQLEIEFSPLLVDSIEKFYLLKPKALHSEIQQVIGKKRVPRTVSLFVQWLLTKNTGTVQVKRETLYVRLRLDYMAEKRQWARLEERLSLCYEVAKKLGYLLDVKEEYQGLLVFTLNPERCKRIGKQEEALEEKDFLL